MRDTGKINVFLSGVSAEFREHREALALMLRRHHFVREQSDFFQGHGSLLDKLESYIQHECHACIFLVGDRFGAEPPAVEAAPFLEGKIDRYSYTQWEYIFATRHNKARFVFVPATGTDSQPPEQLLKEEPVEKTGLQKSFLQKQIVDAGKDRTYFHSIDDLKDEVRGLNLGALRFARYHNVPLNTANPYVGLRKFEERDEELFYGRNNTLNELHTQLTKERIVLLSGHSGSGKSSLVRAGLIPRWRDAHGNQAEVILFRPGQDPFEGLYEGLRAVGVEKADCWRVKEGGVDIHELLPRIPDLRDKALLMVIDQFEELFTRSEEKEERVKNFVTALLSAYHKTSIFIVFTMRDEYFGRLEDHHRLYNVLEKGNRIRRMRRPTESELRAIIEAPAASHGVGFEGELVEQIIRDVRGHHSGVGSVQKALLPLLQVTLEELWNDETKSNSIKDRILNVSSYEAIGSFSGALENRINGFYESLSEEKQIEVQRILLQFVRFGESDHPVSCSVRRSVLLQTVDSILLDDLISKQKLLIASSTSEDERGDGSRIELVHDALIYGWDEFRGWIRRNQALIRVRRRLEQDAESWSKNKARNAREVIGDDLWRGTYLARAEEAWRTGDFERIGGLTREAQDFLKESRAAVEDEVEKLKLLVLRAEDGEARATEQEAIASEQRDRAQLARRAADKVINKILYELIDELNDAGHHKLLEEVNSVAQEYFSTFPLDEADDDTLRERATSLTSSVDSLLKTNRPEKAFEFAMEAVQIAEDLVAKVPDDETYQHTRAVSYQFLGHVVQEIDGPVAACVHYEKYNSIMKELYEKKPSMENARSLAISHSKVGKVKAVLNGPTAAMPHYLKRQELTSLIYERDENARNARSLAISLAKLAQTKLSMVTEPESESDPEDLRSEAKSHFEKALRLLQRFARLGELDKGTCEWISSLEMEIQKLEAG